MNNTPNTGHPRGLYLLFATEMWERFSYYGMRALFVLFMTKALLFDKALGSEIYGSYTGLVYLTPLLGGYLADRYWGNRKSIIIGGVLMAIGQFFMFLSGWFYTNSSLGPIMMFVGLGFLIFGNGFFKPNISTMVGQLYPAGDKRVDGAFTIFYMGINLGAFIAPLICGFLGDTGKPEDFKWGFLCACIGMILSLVLFIYLKDKYLVSPTGEQIGAKPNISRETEAIDSAQEISSNYSIKSIAIWSVIGIALLALFRFVFEMDWIGCFIFSLTIAAPGFIISDPKLTKIERDRIWVILIVATFVIFFWSAFEQAGASLTYFAEEQTNRELFGKTVPTSYFQSINAVAIVIFAPLFVLMWSSFSKRKMEPASPYKQAIGLFLLALGYVVIAIGVKGLEPSVKVSMMWLVSVYTIHTFGELCLSPIGLSMVNKLSPVRLASLLMGVWFLSTSAANKFAGTLSALYPEEVKVVSSFKSSSNPEVFKKLEANMLDTMIWKKSPKENVNIQNAIVSIQKGKTKSEKDSLMDISLDSSAKGTTMSVYLLKVMKLTNSSLACGYVTEIKTKEGSYPAFVTKSIVEKVKDKKLVKVNEIQIWNIKPEKPVFLGMKIENLYDFFMIFVYMAGIASIILFLLSKMLLKMMHGVR